MSSNKSNQNHLDQRTFWAIHNFAKKRRFKNPFSFYQHWKDELIEYAAKHPRTKQRSIIIIKDAYDKKDTILGVINEQIQKKEIQ